MTAAFLAVSAGAASAATVTISFALSQQYPTEHGPPPLAASMSFVAAPGESNDVAVTGVTNGYRIYDAGAPLSGDPAYCSSSDIHTLTCTVATSGAHDSGFAGASFDLGDGNDIFRGIDLSGYKGFEGTSFVVDGGPGNDQLTAGTPTGVTLTGGPGDDTVTGGPGDTLLGSPGHDVLDGGGGALDMSRAGTPVIVDLRHGTAQTAGENDQVSNFHKVVGAGANDRLIAGGGPVELVDRAGHNTLIGGTGPTVLGGSAAGNRIICGNSANSVTDATARDLITGSCRRITPLDSGGEDFLPRLPLHSLSAAVVGFGFQCLGPPCAIRLQLRVARGAPAHQNARPGELLGLRRIILRRAVLKLQRAAVRLSRVGARLLGRDRSLRVTVSFSQDDSLGTFSGAYGTILRRP